MTIGEVSKIYNIPTDTLRYYEKVGLIGPVNKNKSGIRDYDEVTVSQVEFVKCMRCANIPIEALKRYIQLYKDGDKTINERREILLEQRDNINIKLEELQRAKERLDYKIELYDKRLLEKNLKIEK